MEFRDLLFNELVKKGVKKEKSKSIFNIANRSFLYMTPELVKAFLKFRDHPRYSKTVIEIEKSLIKKHALGFIKENLCESNSSCNCNLIDLGCGDGSKATVFLETIGKKGKFRYCPVSVSDSLISLAVANVKKSKTNNVVDYKTHVADLDSLSEVVNLMRNTEYKRNIILLLGSIIASFDIHDYLFSLSNSMLRGDYLIIGNGIRKGERLSNIGNYKNPLFKDWLAPLMAQMGFKENEVEYDARFANGRVECFHKILKDKKLKSQGKEFSFNKGDEVVSAILYKYYSEELEKICKMYFCEVNIFKDSDDEYALIFCKK